MGAPRREHWFVVGAGCFCICLAVAFALVHMAVKAVIEFAPVYVAVLKGLPTAFEKMAKGVELIGFLLWCVVALFEWAARTFFPFL